MKKPNTIWKRAQRWGRETLQALRNAPLYGLVIGATCALETQSGGTIIMLNTNEVLGIRLGFVEAAFCLMCGLLSSYLSVQATALKSDPRPTQRDRAGGARFLSVVLLIIPVFYLGSAFEFQRQMTEYRAYISSPEYHADLATQALAQGAMEMQAVADKLRLATKPLDVDYADPMFYLFIIGAATAYSLISVAIGVGWRPKAETTREANQRIVAERVQKAAETRAKNQKLAARNAGKGQVGRFPQIFQGGRA